MLPEIEKFQKWLRRKSPHASTHIHYVHYVSDVKLFFTWADKPPDQITMREVDLYIEHSQRAGHAIATVNRRLASLRSGTLNESQSQQVQRLRAGLVALAEAEQTSELVKGKVRVNN